MDIDATIDIGHQSVWNIDRWSIRLSIAITLIIAYWRLPSELMKGHLDWELNLV